MNSFEKVNNCMTLKPVNDRKDIPVYPQLLTYAGVFAGISQKAMIDDPRKWMEAMAKTYDHFGNPDVSISLSLGDVIFSEGMEARRPGYELPDNVMFQLIEDEKMNHDDYREIVKTGWNKWYNKHMASIQHPPVKSQFKITLRWIKLGMNGGNVAKFLRSRGIEPISGAATSPIFDILSLVRSFTPFCMDLYDEPGLVQDVLRASTPESIKLTLSNAKRSDNERIHLFAMRSDANSISPDIFDEFSFPYLKQMIQAFQEAGYRTVIHADGNWLPTLDRFLELPKASVHFEFDGVTDMYKAYDIIGGHHSMRGDVPATMMAFGTPDEVLEHCEKLITTIGMKGGFMLGTGCEVPFNCKPENFMAFMKILR